MSVRLYLVLVLLAIISILFVNCGDGKKKEQVQKTWKNWRVINWLTYAVLCDDKEINGCTSNIKAHEDIVAALGTVTVPQELKDRICISKETKKLLHETRKKIKESYAKYSLETQEFNKEEMKNVSVCVRAAKKKNNEVKEDAPVVVVKESETDSAT